MRYFKSVGFFSLCYVLIFLCFSMGISIFFSNGPLLSIITYAGLLCYIIIYMIFTGKDFRKTLRLHKIHPVSILLLILLAFTIRPAAGLISVAGQMFFHDITTSPITKGIMQNFPLMLISTALLPGIVEELIFRGVVYSGLRKGNPIKGIFFSALFFGLAHMNFQQFCYAFFLGLVFGLVVEASDSIFSSMIVHGIFNGSSLVASYILNKFSILSEMTQTAASDSTSWIGVISILPAALIGLILSFFLLIALAYFNGRLGYMKTWLSRDVRKSWPKERATSTSYFAALIICFILSILVEISVSMF